MLKGRIVLLALSCAILLASAIVLVVSQRTLELAKALQAVPNDILLKSPATIRVAPCADISLVREFHIGLTKPLLYTDVNCESEELAPLKQKLSEAIEGLKRAGKLTKSTIYYKELNTFRWMLAGDAVEYYPASMLKVAILMNVLKRSETTTGLLDQKLQLQSRTGLGVLVAPSRQLTIGNFYSVRELLDAMIIRSDNDATRLLFSVMDNELYTEMYAELNIPRPHNDDFYYQISAPNMAKFFRVLYNASYLNTDNSEYALELLTKTEYSNGMVAVLPGEARVARKFGEHFTEGSAKQFHESGIVYFGGSAYVVVIMTEGKELTELESAVSQLSFVCFKHRAGKAQEPTANANGKTRIA